MRPFVPSSVDSTKAAIAARSTHAGQFVVFCRLNLSIAFCSHASSSKSSASFRLASWPWHLRTLLISVPTFFDTLHSQPAMGDVEASVPVSSPPSGVPSGSQKTLSLLASSSATTPAPIEGRSMHAGHLVVLSEVNLSSAACSHASSAASSASFPVCRLQWHLRIETASFPTAFPTLFSHFVIGPFGGSGGMKPPSSPPNGAPGVPAMALAAASAAMHPMIATRNLFMLPSLRVVVGRGTSSRGPRRRSVRLWLTGRADSGARNYGGRRPAISSDGFGKLWLSCGLRSG